MLPLRFHEFSKDRSLRIFQINCPKCRLWSVEQRDFCTRELSGSEKEVEGQSGNGSIKGGSLCNVARLVMEILASHKTRGPLLLLAPLEESLFQPWPVSHHRGSIGPAKSSTRGSQPLGRSINSGRFFPSLLFLHRCGIHSTIFQRIPKGEPMRDDGKPRWAEYEMKGRESTVRCLLRKFS